MKFDITFIIPIVSLFFIFPSCSNNLEYEITSPQFKEGWSTKEITGLQWSEGESSMIILYEDKLSNRKRKIILEGQYFSLQRLSQLLLNNELIGEIEFDENNNSQFDIVLKDDLQPDTLLFKHFDIKSPSDLGVSEDKRRLKLSINTITIQE